MRFDPVRIKRSVGKNCANHWMDVIEIQYLINDNLYLLPIAKPLVEDGVAGSNTIGAIVTYQKQVLKMKDPDGIVGRNGRTLRALNANAKQTKTFIGECTPIEIWDNVFPLYFLPVSSYKSGMRRFGARRDNGKRLHAGCDLYASPGTIIRAINDGVVMRPIEGFYSGTNVLTVKHEHFIARYGEISEVCSGVKNGAKIKKGQEIAHVGKLNIKPSMSMLHLEIYSGFGSGPLTVKGGNKYNRRWDLLDPTALLDSAQL